MNLRFVNCLGPSGHYRLAYREWQGPKGAPTLLCVHGLTRNSRDFDTLAHAMSATHRVVAPDMPGRGESDWLAGPGEYSYPVYLQAITTLIARLDVEKVDWVGTSMGGLIAMVLGATPGHPIRRLVINDASTVIPKAFSQRLATYVGLTMHFDTVEALEASARLAYAPQRDLSDAQWRQVALAGAKANANGGFDLAYDPRIGDAFRASEPADVVLWPIWDKLDCPTLLLRATESPLLRREEAVEMVLRGPKPRLVEWEGLAHPPFLMNEEQMGEVRGFLAG